MRDYQFSEEELELLEAYEKGLLVSVPNLEEEKARAKLAAENWMKEQKQIEILLSNRDQHHLKQIADKQGIPYQNFISNILHNYVETYKD